MTATIRCVASRRNVIEIPKAAPGGQRIFPIPELQNLAEVRDGSTGEASGAAVSSHFSGSGMNSISSPGTLPKWPAFHSALACSMRSLREDTKFTRCGAGPSIARRRG